MWILEIPPAESHLRFTLQQVSQGDKNKHNGALDVNNFRESHSFFRGTQLPLFLLLNSKFPALLNLSILKHARFVWIVFHICQCVDKVRHFLHLRIEELQDYPFHWFCSSVVLLNFRYRSLHRKGSFEPFSHFAVREFHLFETITDGICVGWSLTKSWGDRLSEVNVATFKLLLKVGLILWHFSDHFELTPMLALFKAPLY